jgi:hypothetical protein
MVRTSLLMHLGHCRGDCVRGRLWQLTWKPFAQLSQIANNPETPQLNDLFGTHKKLSSPGCLQVTQVFESGDELVGLTLSIVNPLGRFGIAGKDTNADFDEAELFPLVAGRGGDTLSFFLRTA